MVPGITKHHKAQVPTFERQNIFHPNLLVYWVQGGPLLVIHGVTIFKPFEQWPCKLGHFTPWKHQGLITPSRCGRGNTCMAMVYKNDKPG